MRRCRRRSCCRLRTLGIWEQPCRSSGRQRLMAPSSEDRHLSALPDCMSVLCESGWWVQCAVQSSHPQSMHEYLASVADDVQMPCRELEQALLEKALAHCLWSSTALPEATTAISADMTITASSPAGQRRWTGALPDVFAASGMRSVTCSPQSLADMTASPNMMSHGIIVHLETSLGHAQA